MENEKDDLINFNELAKDSYFKLEYTGQGLNLGDPEFKKWQKSQFDMLGNDIKIYKCKKDNIIFYGPYNTRDILYQCKCPMCKKYICYFCTIPKTVIDIGGNCCIKRKVIFLFLKGAKQFLGLQNSSWSNYFFFLLPFINLFYFIGGIQSSFFITLSKTNSPSEFQDFNNYELYFLKEKITIYWILFALIFSFVCFIMIPFIILDLFITIALLLISIPFNCYPLKYVLGFVVSTYDN